MIVTPVGLGESHQQCSPLVVCHLRIIITATTKTALSGKMMVELADAVDDLERWEVGTAVVLHGAGGNFCAGADLSLAREHLVTGDDGRRMCALMTDTLNRLRRCEMELEVLPHERGARRFASPERLTSYSMGETLRLWNYGR